MVAQGATKRRDRLWCGLLKLGSINILGCELGGSICGANIRRKLALIDYKSTTITQNLNNTATLEKPLETSA